MSIVVIDASAAVDALAPVPRHGRALDLIAGVELISPALIDGEVLSALARLERDRTLTPRGAQQSVADWLGLPVERVPDELLIPFAWSLRHRVRVTDGLYAALAIEQGVPLLTSDGRLARAGIPGLDVRLIA